MALPVLPARGYSRPTHHGTDTQLSTNPARVSAREIPFVRLVSVSLALASVSLGGSIESADIPHAVRPCGVATSSPSRNVICNEIPTKIHINQRLHQLPHVGIAVVNVSLDEIRDGRSHVAKMDLP